MRAVVVLVASGLCLACGRSRLETWSTVEGAGAPASGGSGARETGGSSGELGGSSPVGGSPSGGRGGDGGIGGIGASAGVAGTGARPPLPEGGCTQDGFCVMSPALTANTLNAVWGSGSNDVWAVGDAGAIVHYDGSGWRRVGSGTVARLVGVSGTSPDDVWFVGEDGQSLHYDGFGFDSGAGPRTAAHLAAVHAISPNDVWIATGTTHFPVADDDDFGSVYHFDGHVWLDRRPDPTRSFYRALWAAAPDDVWLVGDRSYHFDSSGWALASNEGGQDVWGSNELGVWMADLLDLWYFDGTTTERAFGDGEHAVMGVWGTSERDLWAVGSAGFIAHDDGSGWTSVSSGTTRALFAIWGSSSSDVWAVGQFGTIVHYDGSVWSNVIPDRAPERLGSFYSIWGDQDYDQWIAGDRGIFAYEGGKELVAAGPDGDENPPSYFSVFGAAWDDVVAVGSAGAIAEFDGSVWSRADSPTQEALRDVWGAGDTLLAVGGHTGVIRSGSPPWQLLSFAGSMNAVWGSSEDDIWVTGASAGVMNHFVGGRWEVVTSAAFPAAMWGTAVDDIWGVGTVGRVSHFDGTTWTFEFLDGSPDLRAVHGCGPTNVWAVGAEGVIVRYDGERWSAFDSGTTNTLHGVRCSPAGLWIVGEGGIVLRNIRNP